MTTELVHIDPDDVAMPDAESARSALDHYLGTGDLGGLPSAQRAALYLEVCRSLGINPRTRPLDWIEFYDPETKGKKLVLYPNKTCTDQLAYLHKIRVRLVEEKTVGTLFKVVVEGTMPDGRQETNVAYLDLTDAQGQPLRGQRYGNALMKCHTKAKRRLVLGMVGMSIPDDDSLPKARRVYVDAGGNVIKTAQQWGDLVRNMYPGYTGHRPRIQLYHGDNDSTINYKNMGESIEEWTNVLGLPMTPTSTDTGYMAASAKFNRQFWKNSCGQNVLEAWTAPGATHSMTYEELEMLKFFGLNAANTPGDADSVFKITQSGSYYLAGNITGVSAKYGVEIAASGVTLLRRQPHRGQQLHEF